MYSNWVHIEEVIKIVGVIIGLFLDRLAYLQSQQIANINWNRLQVKSEDAITTVPDALTRVEKRLSNLIDYCVKAIS